MTPSEQFVVWCGGGALLVLALVILWDIWRGHLGHGAYELVPQEKKEERKFLVLDPDADVDDLLKNYDLPAFGEPHPDDSAIVAVERMVEPRGDGGWLVTVRYQSLDSGPRLFREGGD